MSHARSHANVDELIEKAMKKVGARKSSDLCRYIPGTSGSGYVHHFTLKKWQKEEPTKFVDLLHQYILDADKPSRLDPKRRAARGSRKRRDHVLFTKQDIERILKMAKMAGDDEMVRKVIAQRQDLKALKRELLSSIRQNRVEPHLWQSYVEAIQNQNQTQTQIQTQTITHTPFAATAM
jgi:hypothetical protein